MSPKVSITHDLDRDVADAILATMAPYDWPELGTKADLAAIDERIDAIDTRIDQMDAKFEDRFDRVDLRFDKMDTRFDKMDARFDKMDVRFDGMTREIRLVLLTLVGFMLSVLIGATAVFVS